MQNKKIAGINLTSILIALLSAAVVCLVGYIAYLNYADRDNSDVDTAIEVMESLPGLISSAPLTYSEGMSTEEVLEHSVKYIEVPGLVDALKGYEDNNPCQQLEGRLKQFVISVTSDQTQALIGNGCGGTGMTRSFMIKDGQDWLRVGSWDQRFGDGRNNFNVSHDLPSCSVTDKYQIQSSIAPVCFNVVEGQSDLYSGDPVNYTYTLR